MSILLKVSSMGGPNIPSPKTTLELGVQTVGHTHPVTLGCSYLMFVVSVIIVGVAYL